MLRSSLRLLLVAAPAVALIACSSDPTSGTATGTGGSSTTATGTSTSTGTGGAASTSTATGTGTATSTGTGATLMDACKDAADAAIIMMKDVKGITTTCGQMTAGNEAQTRTCIKMGTGLSDDCASCYSGEVACVAEHCLGAEGKCLIAPDAQLCTDCRKMYCTAAYETCSGNKSM